MYLNVSRVLYLTILFFLYRGLSMNNDSTYLNYDPQEWNKYKLPRSDDWYYLIKNNKMFLVTKIIDKDGKEHSQHDEISRTPFIITEKTEPLEDNTIFYTIRYGENQKEFQVKHADLMDKQKLKTVLGSNGLNVPDNELLKSTLEYISQYISQFNNKIKTTIAIENNGWNNDNTLFAIGRYGITEKGLINITTCVDTPKSLNGFHQMGTVKEWYKIIEPVLKYDLVRFKLYKGMQAPLIKIVGMESNIHEHIGNSSIGKTTTEMIALSAFGNPKELALDAQPITSITPILAYISEMSDIPTLLDECTSDESIKIVSQCVYPISSGNDKARGQKNGKLRNDIKKYRASVSITSEKDLREYMPNQGQKFRLNKTSESLPDTLGNTIYTIKNEIGGLDGTQSKCYGTFCIPYIQYIIKNKDKIEKLYKEAVFKIDGDYTNLSKDVRNIVDRSKFVYAGYLLAGYIVEEIFKELGLPHIDKNEIENIINHFFQNNVINEPIEKEHIVALKHINDWISIESKNFFYPTFEDDKNYNNFYGFITNDEIFIVGTVFNEKMKHLKLSASKIKENLFIEGAIQKNKNKYDFKKTINGHELIGILIIKDKMYNLIGTTPDEKETYDKIMLSKSMKIKEVIDVIKTLTNIRGDASVDLMNMIFLYDISETIEILKHRGKISMKPNGNFVLSGWN